MLKTIARAAAAAAVWAVSTAATALPILPAPTTDPFPGPFVPPAEGTYLFTGTCFDCPTPAASATLVVGPGPDVLSNSTFAYHSSLLGDLEATLIKFIWGDL